MSVNSNSFKLYRRSKDSRMDRKRTRVTWEIEAARKIGVWRQKLTETKVLVHSQFLVDAAHKRGIDVEGVVNQKDTGSEDSLYIKMF